MASVWGKSNLIWVFFFRLVSAYLKGVTVGTQGKLAFFVSFDLGYFSCCFTNFHSKKKELGTNIFDLKRGPQLCYQPT